jgi:tetratricopeptide (TPR) repeat protein
MKATPVHRKPLRIIVVVTACLCVAPALACINAIGTDREGRRFEPMGYTGKDLVASLSPAEDRESRAYRAQRDRAAIDAARKTPDLRTLTDLGIVLIRRGRQADAVRLFVEIERLYPGHYQTAANLGTALELLGHDAIALRWIRIGMRRNRDAHAGTEWLHARILEAKRALQRDPSHLGPHLGRRSVAGIAFAPVALPELPTTYPPGNDGRPVTPGQLNLAFTYQLAERLDFVKTKDPIVADLVEDWATLHLAGGSVESADALYDLALRYGATPTPLLRQRQAKARAILAGAKGRRSTGQGDCPICWHPPPPPPPQRQ